jgi:NADH:ubiquinone oxidoreductase subunit 5 (subunit L)/multisubunit Na+/H+ antiporter MnhA subunit
VPTARIAQGAALGSLTLLAALDLLAAIEGPPGQVILGTWLASGEFAVKLSFTLDTLALSVATLVAAIGAVTVRFSVNYLHRESGFHRFFMILNLFLAGMLLIVLAGNAVLTFVGWELAGVSSYLLIGYAYDRPAATGNAVWAFVTNRIGDAGFMLGIALAAMWLGTVEWPQLAAAAAMDALSIRFLLVGFLLAALVKSAQVPFAPWIARALEGPTPSSAVFYGSVMVFAGVYLVIRLEPLLTQVPDLMALLVLAGTVTVLYGWLGGLVQTDVKSALMFGTITQVGLMFLACGLGWFGLAAWYMGLHAAWRAYQFLMAPSYMHLAGRPARPVPAWLAHRRWAYVAAMQRFWLDHLALSLLVRPMQSVGRDMRAFDDEVLSRMVGMPPEQVGVAGADEVIRGRGLAGRILAWVADHLQRFETHLVLRAGGGSAGRLMRRAGEALLVIEGLLERPRYLLLLVLATFVVIL